MPLGIGIGLSNLVHKGTVLNQEFIDTFDRADGALGNDWVYAGSWIISGNKLVADPSVTGAELLTNGDFETGDPPTGWNKSSTTTIVQDADVRPGSAGTKSGKAVMAGNYTLNRTVSFGIGNFYRIDFWQKKTAGASLHGIDCMRDAYFNDAAWANHKMGFLAYSVSANCNLLGANSTILHDDYSIKKLTPAEIICSRVSDFKDVNIKVKISDLATHQGGLIICSDSATAPTSFILANIDIEGASMLPVLRLYKVTGGVATQLILSSCNFGSDKFLQIKKNSNTIKLYYDEKQISEDVLVTDAAIVNNTIHGIFSTGNTISFNDFSLKKYDNGVLNGTPFFTRVSQTNLASTSGSHDWLGWPWMAKSGTNWVKTYRSATGHNGTDTTALIHIKISTDEGVTWSAEDKAPNGDAITGFPIGIHLGGASPGAMMLIPCPNGDLIGHMYEFLLGTYQYRSLDNGLTWTAEGLINNDSRIISIDDFAIDNGVIYVSVNYTNNSSEAWVNKIYKSSDNGVTWVFQGTYSSDTHTDEGGIAITSTGQMIAIMRDKQVAATYKYTSNDLGVTWSAGVVVPEMGVLQRPKIINYGTGLICHGREIIATDVYRHVVYYSADNGATWGRKFYPDTTTYSDGMYNDIQVRSNGNLYMITYKGTKATAGLRELIFSVA